LRASTESQAKWQKQGMGIGGLGVAVATKLLEFHSCDYRK